MSREIWSREQASVEGAPGCCCLACWCLGKLQVRRGRIHCITLLQLSFNTSLFTTTQLQWQIRLKTIGIMRRRTMTKRKLMIPYVIF